MKREQKERFEQLKKDLKHDQVKILVPQDPVEFCIALLGFIPYKYQENLSKLFLNNEFITARWCGQSGKSYIISALLLWYALAHPNSYIAIVGPSWRQTKYVVRTINAFLSKLPREWYGKPQRTIVTLTNGSRIECFPNSPETIRGPTLDVIYCDEMNFIPNDEEMFDAVMWTLVTKKHGKFICSSTPWNTDSIFWRIWNEDAFKTYAKGHPTWREANLASSKSATRLYQCSTPCRSKNTKPSKVITNSSSRLSLAKKQDSTQSGERPHPQDNLPHVPTLESNHGIR